MKNEEKRWFGRRKDLNMYGDTKKNEENHGFHMK